MATTKPVTTGSKKRKRQMDVGELLQLFNAEPDDYKIGWNKVKDSIIEFDNHTRQMIPSLAPSTLSAPAAREIFNLRWVKDVLWADVDEEPVPQYLSDNIARILAITSEIHKTNEAFSRTILDQIIVSAVYEESYMQTTQQRTSSQPEEPTVLELQYETPIQRQVTFQGKPMLLSGTADYTVWYQSRKEASLATNLIIIEAKKADSTDTCLGQLTAYMGAVHAYRKDERKQNSIIYGVASDGLSFRFCRIGNEGDWSRSRLMEWGIGDQSKIYSVFRSLIRIAALSSPSTSSIKNPRQRGKVLATFSSPGRHLDFDYALSRLQVFEEDDETEIVEEDDETEIVEEDDETEIVGLGESSL